MPMVKLGLSGIQFDETGNVKTPVSPDNPLPVTTEDSIADNLEGGGKISVGDSAAVEVSFSGSTTSILITADKDNTGLLYIGKSNVANDGSNAITYLQAGDVMTLDYEDSTNAIYVIASVAAQNFWKGALL
ncbi:MAG: hypothetical protein ACTSW1_08215 [Candidatus Hodarchaeales archaeon]